MARSKTIKGLGKMITRVQRYLAYRRSLGYVLREEGRLFLDFARYADRVGHCGALTLVLALRWARLPTGVDPKCCGVWPSTLPFSNPKP